MKTETMLDLMSGMKARLARKRFPDFIVVPQNRRAVSGKVQNHSDDGEALMSVYLQDVRASRYTLMPRPDERKIAISQTKDRISLMDSGICFL